MKQKYEPYKINIRYELETYKNIGKDYGNSKTASKGVLFDFLRFVRKRKNKGQIKYRFCDTYSAWEEHINKVLSVDIRNYEDLLHWLMGKKNEAQQYLDAVKAILIPIYVSLISLYKVFGKNTDSLVDLIVMMLVIVFFSVIILDSAIEKVEFYDDFIKVARNSKR